MFFLGLKFWPKVILLGLYSRHWDIFGLQQKQRDFLGYAKKVVIFLGRHILKLCFFWV